MNLPQPNNRIQWLRAFFEASTLQEPFEDVYVYTAKSEAVDKAMERALSHMGEVMENGDEVKPEDVPNLAATLLDSGMFTVLEHVVVRRNGISVCINADSTEDEVAMCRALDMVAEALDQLDGKTGVINFGEKLTFRSNQVDWSFTQ